MNTPNWKTIVPMCLLLAVSITGLAKRPPATANIYAVVIGVSTYADPHIHNLQYADKDARSFADSLQSSKMGGIPVKNMLILINELATRDNIQTEMTRMLLRAEANDLVIFYFSGHGINGALAGSGYLLPYDAVKGKEESSAISMDDIKLKMQRCSAKMCISYVDACHAGLLGEWGKGTSADNLEIQKAYMTKLTQTHRGNAVFMSSASRQESQEQVVMEHGVFTYYLLKGLMGAADTYKKEMPGYNDGIVEIGELQHYLYENIQEATNYSQKPVFNDDYDQDFPLSVVRSGISLTKQVSEHAVKIPVEPTMPPAEYVKPKLPATEKLSAGMAITSYECNGMMGFLNNCKVPVTLYYMSGSRRYEANIRIMPGVIGATPRLYVWGSNTGVAAKNAGECEGVTGDYDFYFQMTENGVDKFAILKVPVEAARKTYVEVSTDDLNFSTKKPN